MSRAARRSESSTDTGSLVGEVMDARDQDAAVPAPPRDARSRTTPRLVLCASIVPPVPSDQHYVPGAVRAGPPQHTRTRGSGGVLDADDRLVCRRVVRPESGVRVGEDGILRGARAVEDAGRLYHPPRRELRAVPWSAPVRIRPSGRARRGCTSRRRAAQRDPDLVAAVSSASHALARARHDRAPRAGRRPCAAWSGACPAWLPCAGVAGVPGVSGVSGGVGGQRRERCERRERCAWREWRRGPARPRPPGARVRAQALDVRVAMLDPPQEICRKCFI